MKSLFDKHRKAIRNVQAAVLVAALLLMIILTAVTLHKAKSGDAAEPYLNRVECTSPARADALDGRYIESYKNGKFQQSVLLLDFVPTGIRICTKSGKTLWEMPGKVVCSLLWSPDARYAAVSYSTEKGGSTIVVDTTDYSEQTVPLPSEAQGAKVWLYAIRWSDEGLLLCWDYGDKLVQGKTLWNP